MFIRTDGVGRGICAPALLGMIVTVSASADIVYENDFEGLIGPEWSDTSTSTTPICSRGFLGEFSSEDVRLTLTDLPAHELVTVSFELFVIRTWDGNGNGQMPGPDRWLFGADGETMVDTTFAVGPTDSVQRQYFPVMSEIEAQEFAPRTGAIQNDSLGYTWNGENRDSVYTFNLEFAHNSEFLVLDFSAIGLQGINDESWGIDNVMVQAVPTPGGLALLGLGGAFAARRRR